MTTRKEFEQAKTTILEYLVATLRRKTDDFKSKSTDKEKRRVQFLMNFLKEELKNIQALKYEDMPDAD